MKTKLFTLPRIIFAVMSIACMALIFHFSSEDADTSTQTSDTVIEIVADVCVADFQELPEDEKLTIMDKMSFYIRKTAHFTIYAMLGFFVSLTVGRRKFFSFGSLGTIVFCFLYAVSDEFHQSFSPGRSCEFRDMMIDTSGALLGMVLSLGVMFVFYKIVEKKRQKKGASV